MDIIFNTMAHQLIELVSSGLLVFIGVTIVRNASTIEDLLIKLFKMIGNWFKWRK